MSIDTGRCGRGRRRGLTRLNCLSALMSIDTRPVEVSRGTLYRGLNCLSALMSIDTRSVERGDVNHPIVSQLPFGFDVN